MAERELGRLWPHDEHNRRWEANVRPPDWINPTPQAAYHLVVIGAGTAGLVTAAGAAALGARVALVERQLLGGDCLNVGCVPSKGLLRSARAAAAVREAAPFGVRLAGDVEVDFGQAMERMRRLRARISPHDSARRFTQLGVDVFFGQAAFVDGRTLSVTPPDGPARTLQFRKAVIATGTRPAVPPIAGLETVSYLTNENLFSLTELPGRFAVVGTGPVGCEMAQAFARLGSQVWIFGRSGQLLSREDPDAAAVIARQFQREGVGLMLHSEEMRLSPVGGDQIQVQVQQRGDPTELTVDRLLVAVGRRPNQEGLNLEAVQVEYDQQGVKVNDYLQTTHPRIYAAGDICSNFKFTHAADFQARIVIQNALFAVGPLGRRRASRLRIPWTTYTSPEVAHVGLSQRTAAETGVAVDTYLQPLAEVDRAILDGQEEGFVKVHTRQGSDRIVGATIVAENAGDMIGEITLAMQAGLGLAQLGATIHPYPTQAEAIRKLGDQFQRARLTPTTRRILDWLRRLNVGR